MNNISEDKKKEISARIDQEAQAACDILRHRLSKMVNEPEHGSMISHGTTIGIAEYLFATALSNSENQYSRAALIGNFMTRCFDLEKKMLEIINNQDKGLN